MCVGIVSFVLCRFILVIIFTDEIAYSKDKKLKERVKSCENAVVGSFIFNLCKKDEEVKK